MHANKCMVIVQVTPTYVALRRVLVIESHVELWLEKETPTSAFQIQSSRSSHLSALESQVFSL